MRLRTFAAIAVIGLAGLLPACGSDSSGGCTQNSNCLSGQVCDSGVCKTAVSTRTIGEACASDAICKAGSSCASTLPDGMCTYGCAGDTCPSGAVCTDLRASGSGFFCSTACTTQADCRTGYTCCAGFGACVPAANCPAQGRPASSDLAKPCTSSAGCTGPGEICAGTASAPNPEFPGGACTAACNPADQSTCPQPGSKCVSTSTGSFCFASCTTTTPDCSSLNAALVCTAGACRAPGVAPSCTPNGSAPLAVYRGALTTPDPGGCQRAVQTPTLQSQAHAQKKVGDVVTFTVPPGTGTISILSQGVPTGSITNGGAQPPDTIAFRGSPIPNSVVPTLITNPSNNVIFDDDPPTNPPPDPSGQDVFYGGFSPWTGMLTVPNASPLLAHTALQGSLPAGQWSFTVNDFARECTNPAHASVCGGSGNLTSTYDVQVILKPGLAPATGTVDLAFYYLTGAGSPKAAAAPTDPNFTRMLQGVARLYANAGLCLGTVSVYDLPNWAVTKFGGSLNADDQSPCGDLSQLFALADTARNQVNFFLVNGFKSGSNGPAISVVGIDGTIPGPSSVGGAVNSGAAVNGSDLNSTQFCSSNSFDPTSCGPDEVAFIVGHEGGHFMGLYHTTEQTGDSFDPLSDTKTCACNACAPTSMQASCASANSGTSTPTLMFNNYCVRTTTTPQCGGGENLMFWLLRPESNGALSPQQGQVMRANPVVR